METWYYEVVSIDGDYANLKRTDIELPDEKLVARALLPEGITVGTKLKYEFLQYEIVRE
ncbi:MAG: chorismate--pyruvate lyase [Lachnospiraceae bacterium]